MLQEYDFSKAIKNPYASQLRHEVTVSIDTELFEYFEKIACSNGVSVQRIINRCLDEYASRISENRREEG